MRSKTLAKGRDHARHIVTAVVVAIALNIASLALANIVCFFEYEGPSIGMRKICYYNCLGEPAAITVSSVALCPLTIHQ